MRSQLSPRAVKRPQSRWRECILLAQPHRPPPPSRSLPARFFRDREELPLFLSPLRRLDRFSDQVAHRWLHLPPVILFSYSATGTRGSHAKGASAAPGESERIRADRLPSSRESPYLPSDIHRRLSRLRHPNPLSLLSPSLPASRVLHTQPYVCIFCRPAPGRFVSRVRTVIPTSREDRGVGLARIAEAAAAATAKEEEAGEEAGKCVVVTCAS